MSVRNVLVVLYDGVQSPDVTGPVEVFAAVDRCPGRTGYAIRTAPPGGGPVRTSGGLALLPDGAPEAARPGPGTTLLVPGGRFTADFEPDYPRVPVEPDPVCVRDGRVATSAGVTAGIDPAPALVETEYDPQPPSRRRLPRQGPGRARRAAARAVSPL
ncbi:DJ-1/PfpI family protein [Streptomyces subrutilus]